jgi:branched-chain amino acid transport system ATP-binding protein
LAPIVVEALFETLAKIRDETGVTMIMVEQKAELALSFTQDAIVLDRGQIVYRGTSAAFKSDEEMQHRLLAVSV